MLSIIKYEWLRRWKFFLAGITVFVIANILVINQVTDPTKDPNTPIILRIFVLILSALLFAFTLALFLIMWVGYTEVSILIPCYLILLCP